METPGPLQQARRAPEVVATDIVFPMDANPYGTMFGGAVMSIMDKVAFIAAVRFARARFVTISTDDIQFLAPLVRGDIVETRARVAFAGRTSVIVRAETWAEKPLSGQRERCASGWFAMAARGSDNCLPVAVPPLLLDTDELRAEAKAAEEFRLRSIARRRAQA
jgi:acyl-CoA hydrolase